MIVHYLGRGHEPFFDEIQNLFTWMGLHKREFFLKEFKVQSLRPWAKRNLPTYEDRRDYFQGLVERALG